MIQYKNSCQISLKGFHLPFGGKLSPENRWVKWSEYQKKAQPSDEDTVLQIQENPYLQYYI